MKNRILSSLLYIVFFVAVWNLLGFLWDTFITHAGYQFNVGKDLIAPAVIALILDVVLQVLQKRKQR